MKEAHHFDGLLSVLMKYVLKYFISKLRTLLLFFTIAV